MVLDPGLCPALHQALAVETRASIFHADSRMSPLDFDQGLSGIWHSTSAAYGYQIFSTTSTSLQAGLRTVDKDTIQQYMAQVCLGYDNF